MTKNEFMTRLMNELHKRNVADAADVAEEYEQHFAFKLVDGYSEEEIAAKLGVPEELAAQFADVPQAGAKHSAVLTWLWLVWADLFFGIFAVLLLSFGAVQAACVLSFGLTGVCLIGNLRTLPYIMLPEMPYWCSAILGLSLLALCVLSVIACIWYFAFCRQLFRSYGRFHQNTLAQSRGGAVLPSLPIVPHSRQRKSGSCAPQRWSLCFCSLSASCSATQPALCPPEASSSGMSGVGSRIEVTLPCTV